MLHVDLAGLVFDRPGGKGVPEATHVGGVHARPLSQPVEQRDQAEGRQGKPGLAGGGNARGRVESKQSLEGRMAPRVGGVLVGKAWMARSGLPITDVGIKSPLLYQLS